MDRDQENTALSDQLRAAAHTVGYADCGFTTACSFTGYAADLAGRANRFPEAASFYTRMSHRTDPRKGAPWAKSIVVCVRPYSVYRMPSGVDGYIGRNYLFDRRIPQCPGHSMPAAMEDVFRRAGIRFKRGGVPDRAAAARAGVAAIGRNGFAFHQTYGSWINIESWRVDAELPADDPVADCPCPENCTACIDACPTAALCEPFLMRMDHCVAYLTYHAPRPISSDLWRAMGTWIYGCDACQTVCPLNHNCWRELRRAEWLEEVLPYLKPSALAEMDDETYRHVVHPLFWYIPANDPERWRTNAKRALAAADGPGEG